VRWLGQVKSDSRAICLPNAGNRSRAYLFQCQEQLRNEGIQIINIVRRCDQDYQGKRNIAEVLLVGNVLIRRNDRFKCFDHGGGEKSSIFQPRPAHKPDGEDLMALKPFAKILDDALIKKDFHAAVGGRCDAAILRTATAFSRDTVGNCFRK
jgi:hypothetical protein